jgi:hypothetical protein
MIKPIINEIKLKREYKFMYEGFIISTQYDTYLFLDAEAEITYGLKFNLSYIYKFGYPNDEVLGAHELYKNGLPFYSICEVINSPWIQSLKEMNKIHPMHNDNLFKDKRHYIITMKDNTFEIVCKEITEITFSTREINTLVIKEISKLENQ